MKMKLILGLLSLALLALASPAYAIPALPHAFYGDVEINGAPALTGTQISATVDVGEIVSVQNPVSTTGDSFGTTSPKLLVQGDIPPGATITFHVTNENGTDIGGTSIFEVGGGPTGIDLFANIPEPEPEPEPDVGNGGGAGGAAGGAAMYVETNLFGAEAEFRIDSETGEILKTIEATSEDGNLTLYLPKGTIALDKDGEPLDSLEVSVDESPPDQPVNAHIIGLPYIFEPSGAIFDPPITLTWSYDPDALPEGVAEEDQVIAYYDEEAGEWVELECVVDPITNTITASISHFTTFSIMGFPPAAFTSSSLAISPAEVAPAERVNISISVANTGAREGSYTVVLEINGVKEAEKSVTIAAGGSKTVTFSVSRRDAGSYRVAVDGLSDSFIVLAPPPPISPAPAPPVPAPPVPAPPAPAPPAPAPTPPVTPVTPEEPAPGINWALWGAIIAGVVVVVVGLVVYFVRRRAD